jgi:uncharacterized protein YlzI (FlbEa/FlbD family)
MPMTPRRALPMLSIAQAHKEITHNEALFIVDFLLNPVAEEQLNAPPATVTTADAGKCWLVGENPTGIWSDHAQKIACWTGEGWRYAEPVDGMDVWLRIATIQVRYVDGGWLIPSVVTDPQGGSVIDLEARGALIALLSHFRQVGIISA